MRAWRLLVPLLGALGPWLLASGAALAQGVDLLAQLDPLAGNDRYADVWAEGDYAYVGSFQGTGVAIIDISVPTQPFLETVYQPASGGQFKDVKVADGIGYFASDDGLGLHIVDLADPTAPTLMTQVGAAEGGYDEIHNVFVADGVLYEADSRTPTIKVIDVGDPLNPFFVRDIVTPDTRFIHDVTVVGTRLFASGFGGFTHVYDVSQVGTTAPPLLGSVPTGANSHSSWATRDGTILISAQEISDGTVTIFDVADPANPMLLATLDRSTLGIDAISPHNPVLFDDGLLLVSWYQAGVQVIDIRDPANPVHLGGFDTYPAAVTGYDGNWGVYPLLGLDRVLASDLDGGLFVLDASGLVPEPVPTLSATALCLLAIGLLGTGARAVSVAHGCSREVAPRRPSRPLRRGSDGHRRAGRARSA